jgi:hypothetical protein
MVFSYYLIKIPYTLIHKLVSICGGARQTVFYCGEMLDWEAFKPVQKYLKQIEIVTDKPIVRKALMERGIRSKQLPVFPWSVIMARHACHKFPAMSIIKIGMRHGPYHFKRFTSAENYNLFNLYLMTSPDDVLEGKRVGVSCGVSVGYPRLDSAIIGDYSQKYLDSLKQQAQLTEGKPILLFSATWNHSGMSAVNLWYQRLHELKDRYNVIVTLHPWTSDIFKNSIRNQGIHIIEGDHIPWLCIADIVIGDTSSLLGEACALDKSLITFRMEGGKRSLDKIETMIKRISLRITDWDGLKPAIERYLQDPVLLNEERAEANRLMFDVLDGKAGQRAAEEIIKLLPELKP